MRVAEFIIHENYDPTNEPPHDIGLIHLLDHIDSPVSDFTVKLPLTGSYIATGTPAVLIGWGYNGTEGAVLMPNLLRVDLQIFRPSIAR